MSSMWLQRCNARCLSLPKIAIRISLIHASKSDDMNMCLHERPSTKSSGLLIGCCGHVELRYFSQSRLDGDACMLRSPGINPFTNLTSRNISPLRSPDSWATLHKGKESSLAPKQLHISTHQSNCARECFLAGILERKKTRPDLSPK